jgi:hypothetical protein
MTKPTTKRVAVSIQPTPCELGTIVKYHGIEVAFIQGDYYDLAKSRLSKYTRNVYEGYSLQAIQEAIKYGGIQRLNQDDFARR